MASMNIKSLSVADLLSLRSDIDRVLQSKKSQLAEIGGDGSPRASRAKGSKVAAKYRNPATGETWSGRGGVAGWLAAELKAGKKREEFLIDKSDTEKAPKRSKGGRGRVKAAKQ